MYKLWRHLYSHRCSIERDDKLFVRWQSIVLPMYGAILADGVTFSNAQAYIFINFIAAVDKYEKQAR